MSRVARWPPDVAQLHHRRRRERAGALHLEGLEEVGQHAPGGREGNLSRLSGEAAGGQEQQGDVGGVEVGAQLSGLTGTPDQPRQPFCGAPAPENLTPVQAVSLLTGGTTAVTALREKAAVEPGERLLVRGASGGVGSVVVQIGKLFGAHVVALAGADNLDFNRPLAGLASVLASTVRGSRRIRIFNAHRALEAGGVRGKHVIQIG